jgi:hypothetical protein
VAVAEGHEVHATVGDRCLDRAEHDPGLVGPVRRQDVDRAVAGDDAQRAVGGELGEGGGDQVGPGALGPPRRPDQGDAGGDLDRVAPRQDVDVGRPVRAERLGPEDRRRVERVVVAGQEEDGDLHLGHRLEAAEHDLSGDVVALEDVAADDHEVAALRGGERTEASDGIDAAAVKRAWASVSRKWRDMPSCQSAVWTNLTIPPPPLPAGRWGWQ